MATLPYADTSLAARPGSFIGRLASLWVRWAKSRRARRELLSLRNASDHILTDIGVTRAELERVLSSPIWVNPADRLARRR